MLEKRVELAEGALETAAGAQVDLGAEPPPAADAAGGARAEEAGAKDEKAEPDAAALLEEVAKLREEVQAFRSLPGETPRLLAVLADPSAKAEERRRAIWSLLGQCDVLAHAGELLDAFRNAADPETRAALRAVVPALAAKFHSREMVDAAMEDLRDGGNAEACAEMLARFHGTEGIGDIQAYLGDQDESVRRTAIAAIGKDLPKSDAVVTALRSAETTSGDPAVRGLAAFYLAGRDEPFSYDGMVDDWRALTFGMKADDFRTLSTPPDKIFGRLTPAETARVLWLIGDLGQSHPDENVRNFMKRASEQLQQAGVGKK